MFFNYLTSCCNINIHHIHVCSDFLCLNNRLNLYYCHKFPMKHLLHLSKLWIVYHFMSIQTTNVACIRRCLLWFLTLLGCLCNYHCHVFLLFACLHIVINHSTIIAKQIDDILFKSFCNCFHYIELNTLTWASESISFLKLGYLRATMFGLAKWPFMWLGIP
jgi:hypothetical protein